MAPSRRAARVLIVDVRAIGQPDISVIETLARLVLEANRRDRRVRVVNAPPGLGELVGFLGLGGAIRVASGSGSVASPTLDERRTGRPISPGAPGGRTSGRTGRCRGRT